jgi:CubicO group peptidase (beta-lactamase class C family)
LPPPGFGSTLTLGLEYPPLGLRLILLFLGHAIVNAIAASLGRKDAKDLIVEAVSGESYAAYVQNHIFGPLDMRHSYTTRTEAQKNGLALGYRYWFGYPVADPNEQFPLGSLAAGELISSTEDLSHYLIAQLNDGRYGSVQILSPEGIAEMHRPAADFKMMGVSLGQYGMGWFINDRGQTRIVWHDGVVPDFYAYMAILPGQKKGIVLLMNADHFLMSNTALVEMGMGAATRLAGAQPDPVLWGVIIPWALRGLLLIPVLQILGVALTLRYLLCLQVRGVDERQRNKKGGALPFGGLEPDAAPVSFDESPAEVKT